MVMAELTIILINIKIKIIIIIVLKFDLRHSPSQGFRPLTRVNKMIQVVIIVLKTIWGHELS